MDKAEMIARVDAVGLQMDGLPMPVAIKVFSSVLCTCLCDFPKEERVGILNEIIKDIYRTLEEYEASHAKISESKPAE